MRRHLLKNRLYWKNMCMNTFWFLWTFSRWIEAFPCKNETAQIVIKKLLKKFFPRFRVPKAIVSDNGPAFVAQVSQGVAKYLEVKWKLYCVYRPQSSGQIERINRTLKETLTKLTMETGTDLVLLPLALFKTENIPSWFSRTLFEILYGASMPITV